METNLISKIEGANANNPRELLALIDWHETTFHKQHFLILVLKWLVITLIGRRQGWLNHQVSRNVLERKVLFCEEYMAALNIVDPGISHNRGEAAKGIKTYCTK